MEKDINYQSTHYHSNDDEIDLRELIKTLVKKKGLILFVSILFTLVSIIYAFITVSTYKATTSFLPPTQADVHALNISNIYTPNIETIYSKFDINLRSIETRRQVFDEMQLLKHFVANTKEDTNVDAVFSYFNQNLKVEKPKAKKGESEIPQLFLSIEGKDPELLANILNQIAKQADQITKSHIFEGITLDIQNRKQELEKSIMLLRQTTGAQKLDEIERLKEADVLQRQTLEDQIRVFRETAKAKRLDSIATLTEAANIAKQAGLLERSPLLSYRSATTETSKPSIYTEFNTQQQPLYLRGEKALRAEINELKARKSDDPFIPKLRELQEQLELLKQNRKVDILLARETDDPFIQTLRDQETELKRLELVTLHPERIRTARVDQAAFPPDTPIKPNKKLIIALGIVLGLMMGVIIALIQNWMRDNK